MNTAEQFARIQDDGNRYELVSGEIRMMSPAGGRHGRISVRVSILLGLHVDKYNLGATFAAETGFRITSNPDTVRAPDASFVSNEKLSTLEDDIGFLPFAPDLAVEVISPNDSFASVENKAFGWLNAGTKLVLVVVPESRSIHAYRSTANITVYGMDDSVDASDAVPEWRFDVADVFRLSGTGI